MIDSRIRELRKQHNLTQRDLAEKLNVTAGAVGLWEAGKREPDSKVLIKLSKIFNVTLDYIIDSEQENTITVIGSNGQYEKFMLNDIDLCTMKRLAESLAGKKVK